MSKYNNIKGIHHIEIKILIISKHNSRTFATFLIFSLKLFFHLHINSSCKISEIGLSFKLKQYYNTLYIGLGNSALRSPDK